MMIDKMQHNLQSLNERSREIFRHLVENYLETGEPVGSRLLSKQGALNLSPASIRNVMADLEELGLIYAPHTSAGRLPTDAGLRLFVDAILEIGDVAKEERSQIETQLKASGSLKNFETMLNEASALLSGLSQGAGIVVSAKQNAKLKHIEFVPLDPARALVVLVDEEGHVENRVVALPKGLTPTSLIEASNFLNAHVRGKTFDDAKRLLHQRLQEAQLKLDTMTRKLVEDGVGSLSADADGQSKLLIVHGRANLLQNVAAVEELERLRLLFEDLEREKEIIDILGAAEQAEGVRIFIGSENKLFSLSGSSLVAAPFRDSEQKIIGVLGVIGPTRLNYGRIVPMVDYTAKLLSRMISAERP